MALKQHIFIVSQFLDLSGLTGFPTLALTRSKSNFCQRGYYGEALEKTSPDSLKL